MGLLAPRLAVPDSTELSFWSGPAPDTQIRSLRDALVRAERGADLMGRILLPDPPDAPENARVWAFALQTLVYQRFEALRRAHDADRLARDGVDPPPEARARAIAMAELHVQLATIELWSLRAAEGDREAMRAILDLWASIEAMNRRAGAA